MAGMSAELGARAQLSLIATLRWQLFSNSLRTIRGRLEVVSRVFVGLMMGVAWVGLGIGLGAGAFFIVSQGKAEWLAGLLWFVLLFWQLFPLVASAFSAPFEFTNLLRFPIRFSSFFLLALAYGLFDPSAIAGCFWLLCIAAGAGIARPDVLLWAVPALLAFAAVNLLLARMIYVWVERWLAQRRTREALAIIFFLFLISFQFIGPIVGRWGNRARPMANRVALLLPVEQVLPPGLASRAVVAGSEGNMLEATAALALLCAYGFFFAWPLRVRLLAQYRGENLGESVAPKAVAASRAIHVGWNLPGLPGPVAAIFEKELRYLLRSGPLIFTLVMPVFVLVIFRLTPATSSRGHGNPFASAPDLAFPIGAAYALLLLTNLVYNSLGADAAGVQFFFAAPVRFRDVLLAKNLAHSTVLVFEIFLVWIGVCLMFQSPSPAITFATLAGVLFALPVNLMAGNLLSLYSPRKFDFGAFGKQRASGTTVFASMGVQAVVIGLAAATILLTRLFKKSWLAAPILLALAAFALWAYLRVLDRCTRIALDRREVLIAELSKQ